MSDTFITVVAIILAVVLVIVVPLVVTSQRVDNVSQLDVEALTSNFVDEMRATGKLTLDNYDKFLQNLTATGNTYDVSMEFKILDENPGKKSMQTTKDKIGENVYYSIYTTQIEEVLKSENTYNLKQGDMVSVTVRNTNLTLGQELKNFAYKIVGNDTYTISASNSGLIVGNGSTDVILANNVNEDTIGYTLRENDSNGTILNLNGEIKNKNGWTNQNVYVELYPINSTYNFDLLYYWRYANKTEYKNDGNNLVFEGEGKYQIQVYWKHSILEKYSNIKTIDIKIDRQKPTIGSVTSSKQKGNIGTIYVNDVRDTGESGIYGYYYVWTEENETPTPPTSDLKYWTKSSASSFTIMANPENNGKKCTVWIRDNAGNISDSKSVVVKNIVPKVFDFSLSNKIVKKGENLIIQPQNIVTQPAGNIIDYKKIQYLSSNNSVATVNSNGVITGLNEGTTEITCIIENYDGTQIVKTCIVTVVNLSYSPNGGNFVLPYDDNRSGMATIKSTVTISGENYAEYAWSTSNSSYPNTWTAYASKTGGTVSKTSTTASVYYLWTKVSDGYGNSVIYVSNAFSISANKIEIKPDKTSWTNGNIICSITYPGNTVSYTRKAAYGNSLPNAVVNSNSASPPTTSVTVSSNGYVYAEATDIVGNKVTASIQITTIDKTPPSVPTITHNSGSNECKWENNINITLSSTDNATEVAFYEIDWDGNGSVDTTTGSNFIPWNGWHSHNTRFRAVDGVGNRSEWTNSIHVHMDTESPKYTNFWLGEANPTAITLYIKATDNASEISRVACPTSTEEGKYDNWVWFDAEWDSDAKAYRVDMNPATWGHFNTTYKTHLYIWDNAGNGGKLNEVSYWMGNAVAYNYSTERYYSSLASAISASEDETSNVTVKLITDTTENITISQGKDITINLNGKTLTGTGDNNVNGQYDATVMNFGTLKIYGGTAKGNDWVLYNQGNLTVEGGTYKATGFEAVVNYNNTVTINNGYFEGNNFGLVNYNGTTNINDGKIVGNKLDGINVEEGNLNIAKGTIEGKNYGVRNSGTLNMSGGTISSNYDGLYNLGVANLNGGKITTNVHYGILNEGTLNMSGGEVSYTGNANHTALMNCGILTMSGGTITSNAYGLVGRKGGYSEVYNAKISSSSSVYWSVLCDDSAIINIYDSKILGSNSVVLGRNERDGECIRLFNCEIGGTVKNELIYGKLSEVVRTTTGYIVYYYDTFGKTTGVWMTTWANANGIKHQVGTSIENRYNSRVFKGTINKSDHGYATGIYNTQIFLNGYWDSCLNDQWSYDVNW